MKKLLMLLVSICSITFGAVNQVNYSAQIDAVLDKQYVTSKVQPLPRVNDDTFVRRAYLSIIGRIPTANEYDSFTKVIDPNKRTGLVAYLLKHPGYVSNMFNFWAESLRLRDRLAPINNFNGGPYIDYIKDSIAANKPYNKFVTDLLTSSGSYYDNPATGYYYRDLGMPMDNLIATGKVFMGTDIGCAQCHDHLFDTSFLYLFLERINPQIGRSYSVDGRDHTSEDMVDSPELPCVFNSHYILDIFNNTDY